MSRMGLDSRLPMASRGDCGGMLRPTRAQSVGARNGSWAIGDAGLIPLKIDSRGHDGDAKRWGMP